jgi:hypothetical protein
MAKAMIKPFCPNSLKVASKFINFLLIKHDTYRV